MSNSFRAGYRISFYSKKNFSTNVKSQRYSRVMVVLGNSAVHILSVVMLTIVVSISTENKIVKEKYTLQVIVKSRVSSASPPPMILLYSGSEKRGKCINLHIDDGKCCKKKIHLNF